MRVLLSVGVDAGRVRSHTMKESYATHPGMRHFRPPLFALAVLVVASLCGEIIHAQSLRGPTQDDALVYPACVRCPEPSLTRSERLHNFEGFVLLQATVTKRGRAEQIEVVKSLESGLANRALGTVRRWRFRPAIGEDGKPKAARIGILVFFGLRKKGGGIATG
jgi:TonB family protein